MIVECSCLRGTFNDERFSSCYQCYLDRADTMASCIYCSRWHNPKYAMCYSCREQRGSQADSHALALRMEILLRDGFACYVCGSHDMPSVDHVRPVPLGGGHEPWNLSVLCRACARIKGNDTYEDVHRRRRGELMRTYLTYGWKWLDGELRILLCDQALRENSELGGFARFSHFREFLGATTVLDQWMLDMADEC